MAKTRRQKLRLTAEQFNAKYDINSDFMYNGRKIKTRGPAFEGCGQVLVQVYGRAAGVLVSELSLI